MTRGPEECKQPHALARLQYEAIRVSRGILRSPGAAHASFLVWPPRLQLAFGKTLASVSPHHDAVAAHQHTK